MSDDEIDEIVCDILIHEGPDRHVDGHEYLTAFVIAVRDGKATRWYAEHIAKRESYKRMSDAEFLAAMDRLTGRASSDTDR